MHQVLKPFLRAKRYRAQQDGKVKILTCSTVGTAQEEESPEQQVGGEGIRWESWVATWFSLSPVSGLEGVALQFYLDP